MEYFPEKNPNPVICVGTDGVVLYSNSAGEPLLCEWGVRVGEKVPSHIEDFSQMVVLQNSPEKMEVKVGNKTYHIAFHPLPEDECVNIYGFDISDQKELEKKLRESEERERARSNELAVVLDAVPAAVWVTHDPKALHITGNRLSYEWLRLPEGANVSKSAPEGERPESFRMFRDGIELQPEEMPVQMSAAGKEIRNYEFDIAYPNGSVRHILGNASPLCDEQGKTKGSISAFIDITDRKRAEDSLKKAHENLEENVKARTAELEEAYKSLRENERRLSEAQKMARLGNWDRKLDGSKLYWSDEMYRIFGLKPQEIEMTYDIYLSFVHPDDQEYINNALRKAFDGKPFDIDYRIISANGDERIVHAQGDVVFDEKNIPVKIRGTAQDITERKRVEEKIKILADVVESSNDAIVTESLDCIITGWNKGAEQIYGYSAEEVLEKNISILEPDNIKGEVKKLVERVKLGEKIQHYETLRLKKDGTIINVSITLSPIFNTYGKLVAISAIARDVTYKKKAEETLLKLELARKKEIHHRIKNNLQVISSLLELQAEQFTNRECIKDSEVLRAFKESHDRVLSISLIHEELHEGQGEETLDFSLYLEKLAENLFHTYSLGNTNVNLNLDLEENVFFDMDAAVPLGMIVNELVSNSLKYAFLGRKVGEIQIKLYKEEKIGNELQDHEECPTGKGSEYTLIVSDDGAGIPEKIDLESTDSLGLQLVNILVDQLDGKIELKRKGGTKFIIRFNVA